MYISQVSRSLLSYRARRMSSVNFEVFEAWHLNRWSWIGKELLIRNGDRVAVTMTQMCTTRASHPSWVWTEWPSIEQNWKNLEQ